MYNDTMFWLGDGYMKSRKSAPLAADGVIIHRNLVLNEVKTELNKLRMHKGGVTWRDVIEAVERLKA